MPEFARISFHVGKYDESVSYSGGTVTKIHETNRFQEVKRNVRP